MTAARSIANDMDDVVDSARLVVVDFFAEWCPPCRQFAPVFERAARRHSEFAFGKVDTSAHPEIAERYGIAAIPTLLVFRDGALVRRHVGALSDGGLDQLIAEADRGEDDPLAHAGRHPQPDHPLSALTQMATPVEQIRSHAALRARDHGGYRPLGDSWLDH
jgi:thioredoxin 1